MEAEIKIIRSRRWRGEGRSTSLLKGGTPNLEAPLDEDQASWRRRRESWQEEPGGMEELGWGGEGPSAKSGWSSTIFIKVIVSFQFVWKSKSKLHFCHFHFFYSCYFVILTDIFINQGLYTTWRGGACLESLWNTLLFVSLDCLFVCPMQQKTTPIDK